MVALEIDFASNGRSRCIASSAYLGVSLQTLRISLDLSLLLSFVSSFDWIPFLVGGGLEHLSIVCLIHVPVRHGFRQFFLQREAAEIAKKAEQRLGMSLNDLDIQV